MCIRIARMNPSQIKEEKLKEQLSKVSKEITKLDDYLKSSAVDFSSKEYVAKQKRYHELVEKKEGLSRLLDLLRQLKEVEEILRDSSTSPDFLELALNEKKELTNQVSQLYAELFDESKGIDSFVMEIRAGAGGEEAALFASDLFRMYSLFLQDINASLEIADISYSDRGGYKFISALVKGPGVYRWFKYESGVHRVQRVPVTESSGRIHTSTVSVAILPEYKDSEVTINPSDLEITPIKASGPGGQHVNKNLTAIRIKHIPTGLVVTSQRYKSQKQNKDFALRLLKAKLQQAQQLEKQGKLSELRRSQIGTMDRSEKIRTYNYPQSRVTDHRVKKSWYNLDAIMDGKIKDMLEEIITILDSRNEQNQAA